MAKKTSSLSPEFTHELVSKLRLARKYRLLNIPSETITNLIEQNRQAHPDPVDLEQVVRQKLHNLVAPYLGDPDYSRMMQWLPEIAGSRESGELEDFCTEVLNSHASTRERLPIVGAFYESIFAVSGKPRSILDLACGLNPFAIPWMGLAPNTDYHAYDLHLPRVELINAFFKAIHQAGQAFHADILVNPPQDIADVAFFFKEAHRFDQRHKGCNRDFFTALNVKYLLVSLPTLSLTWRHSKVDQDRRLIEHAVSGTNWNIQELIFESEIVFCIRKST